MRFLKFLAAPALALSFVGLSPASIDTARAAPAAGVLAVDRGDVKPAAENVHYRRHYHRRVHHHHRHYRPYRYHHVHRHHRPYHYGHYRSYTPGFYLSIGPRFGYGHRGWW